VLAVAACALALAGSTAVAATSASAASTARSDSQAWSPFFDATRAVPAIDGRHLLVTFSDPSLGDWERAGTTPLTKAQRAAWVRVALKRQQERLDAMATAGVQFQIVHRYVKVLNGVSIAVHGDGAQLLRAVDGVDGVSQVRTVWPMSVDADGGSAAAGAGAAPGAAADGDAPRAHVRVAVLDSTVDPSHAAVRGHVGAAFDATQADDIANDREANGDVEIDDPHGTSVAGVVLAGADAARDDVAIEPIRVLSQRPTMAGNEALLGSSDDVLAGLEHAVDPNGDGNLADGADVAVIASGTPFAGFADGPETRAVAGAAGLGTVVVAASGNDGASGDGVGTISSFAAANDAISVGAVDARRSVPVANVHIEGAGVDQDLADRPVLNAVDLELPGGAVPIVGIDGDADDVTDYLDEQLRSRVAGRIALVFAQPDVSVARQVRAAADAGARGVLIAARGAQVAAGTIDAHGADIPVVAVPVADAVALHETLAHGDVLTASFDESTGDNQAYGDVAGFASSGARLDGIGRVDLVGPGVGVKVAGADGGWRTLSGTSVAAGWVAGQVAASRVAHEDLSAPALRAVVIGAARALGTNGDRPSVQLQGAGVPSADAAGAAAWRAGTGRVDFGSVAAGGETRHALDLTAVLGSAAVAGTGGKLTVLVDDGGQKAGPHVSLDGDVLVLHTDAKAADGMYGGWLVLPDLGVRVPWTASVVDASKLTVPMRATLSNTVLKPVFGPGAYASTLTLGIGGQANAGTGALALDAAQRVQLRLVDATGKDRGVVGGLDTALPGVYEFGLTTLGADGKHLAAGAWKLQVRYVPAGDPTGAWRTGPAVDFTVARIAKP
jgi:hypothetical protein